MTKHNLMLRMFIDMALQSGFKKLLINNQM